MAIILLDDEGNEIIMPRDMQIPSDFLEKEIMSRCYRKSRNDWYKALYCFVTTSPKFLEKLFEQEILKF